MEHTFTRWKMADVSMLSSYGSCETKNKQCGSCILTTKLVTRTNYYDSYTSISSVLTPCVLDIHLYLAVMILIFLATWAEITNQPKSKQITFHRGDFMYHIFFMNCLVCPRGVKYKWISNNQTVCFRVARS
jgi:hypothetical protein